jgi:hypothetical protein
MTKMFTMDCVRYMMRREPVSFSRLPLWRGIDIVEVSNSDLTLLAHGYYGDAEAVLYHEAFLNLFHQLLRRSQKNDVATVRRQMNRLRREPATRHGPMP